MKETVEEHWEFLMSKIDQYISEPRRSKLIKMYEKYSERVCTSPASSTLSRHGCKPGGYIEHVNNIIKCAEKLYDTWTDCGANTTAFSKEELIFSVINHDLGKIGNDTEEYYIPNDSSWHVEKRGEIYKLNPSLTFMKVPDRSLYLLQLNGIEVSENEFLAIKLHDGLYSKGNESYYMAGTPDLAFKNDLPILVHHADHLATLIEKFNEKIETPSKVTKTSKAPKVNNPIADKGLKSAFDDLFND